MIKIETICTWVAKGETPTLKCSDCGETVGEIFYIIRETSGGETADDVLCYSCNTDFQGFLDIFEPGNKREETMQ